MLRALTAFPRLYRTCGHLLLVLIFGGLCQNCTAIRTQGDALPPGVTLYAKPAAANIPGLGSLIGSSDTTDDLNGTGCPAGTFYAGERTSVYFRDLPETLALALAVDDPGGIRRLEVTLAGPGIGRANLTNLRTPFDAEAETVIETPSATQMGRLVVTVTFGTTRTLQNLLFDLNLPGDYLLVGVEAQDYNSNTTIIPLGDPAGINDSDIGFKIMDLSHCADTP